MKVDEKIIKDYVSCFAKRVSTIREELSLIILDISKLEKMIEEDEENASEK